MRVPVPYVCIGLLAGSMVPLGIGCSADGYEDPPMDADYSYTEYALDDGSDAETSADTAIDSTTSITPNYWTLAGTVTLVEGVVDPLGTQLFVSLWLDEAEPFCTFDLPPSLFDAKTDDATSALFTWWEIELLDESTECYWPGPSQTQFGIGPMDPLLNPALAAEGLTSETLYALYLRTGKTEPLYVYGAAGTPDQYSTKLGVDVVEEPPLPDGSYTLRALHLLPF